VHNLGTKLYEAVGRYRVTVHSGDDEEYRLNSVDGSCEQTFERLSF
jgi:hypothetical protein